MELGTLLFVVFILVIAKVFGLSSDTYFTEEEYTNTLDRDVEYDAYRPE